MGTSPWPHQDACVSSPGRWSHSIEGRKYGNLELRKSGTEIQNLESLITPVSSRLSSFPEFLSSKFHPFRRNHLHPTPAPVAWRSMSWTLASNICLLIGFRM